MNDMTAICGLDCGSCEARLATVRNDDELRAKVAADWSKLNGVDITPDMIRCEGCRGEGVKSVYCEALCPIRQCAIKKGKKSCGFCSELQSCKTVAPVLKYSESALHTLLKEGGRS